MLFLTLVIFFNSYCHGYEATSHFGFDLHLFICSVAPCTFSLENFLASYFVCFKMCPSARVGELNPDTSASRTEVHQMGYLLI